MKNPVLSFRLGTGQKAAPHGAAEGRLRAYSLRRIIIAAAKSLIKIMRALTLLVQYLGRFAFQTLDHTRIENVRNVAG